jgi:hypothetical protein
MLLNGSSLAQDIDSDLSWDKDTGWVQLKTRHALQAERIISLCWLPMERRGTCFATDGRTLVIGARSGAITILNLAGMLPRLDDSDAS